MPVQEKSRTERLSGTDLTLLASAKVRGSCVVYKYNPQGWYLHKPDQPAIFIGPNWVAAHDFISKLPISSWLGGAL